MARTVELIERCVTGFATSGDVVRFDPELPAEVSSLPLRLRYRRCWLDAPGPVTVARYESLAPKASVDWPY